MNAGIWIGIFGGLAGIIVAIVSVLTTAGSAGIYITAGILLIFGGMFYLFYRLFFAPMILAARLKKTGLPGQATIREVLDTGVTINNNPQVKLVLDVKGSLGQRYDATIRVLVSRIRPNLYQPGMTVAVLIDPNNEKNIVLDDSGGTLSKTANAFSRAQENSLKEELMKEQAANDAIRLTGRSARALIKKYTWLGVNINGNNPYSELEIEVLPSDLPSFPAKVKGVISEKSLEKYQPGKEIMVKYDVGDLSRVTIDHS
ncbi:MAG: hypothetical protein IPI66_03635 [Chitinophagaceae bacterium]|nr:hypothetical protein [Chitinophagaceae bacterium]